MKQEQGKKIAEILREAITEEGFSKEKLREAFNKVPAHCSQLQEHAFKKGDKKQLIAVMSLHLQLKKPVPEWAQAAFLEACFYQPKCWDDVFGRPNRSGVRKKEAYEAFFEASELRKKGLAIDAGLFEELAKIMRMS